MNIPICAMYKHTLFPYYIRVYKSNGYIYFSNTVRVSFPRARTNFARTTLLLLRPSSWWFNSHTRVSVWVYRTYRLALVSSFDFTPITTPLSRTASIRYRRDWQPRANLGHYVKCIHIYRYIIEVFVFTVSLGDFDLGDN